MQTTNLIQIAYNVNHTITVMSDIQMTTMANQFLDVSAFKLKASYS